MYRTAVTGEGDQVKVVIAHELQKNGLVEGVILDPKTKTVTHRAKETNGDPVFDALVPPQSLESFFETLKHERKRFERLPETKFAVRGLWALESAIKHAAVGRVNGSANGHVL